MCRHVTFLQELKKKGLNVKIKTCDAQSFFIRLGNFGKLAPNPYFTPKLWHVEN